VAAVAKANHLPASEVRGLVTKYSAPVYLGVFGSPYVNVLSLNMALAKLAA
jgi:K+-transporting ATPase ATPase C chain